jgi:hypothetical protein
MKVGVPTEIKEDEHRVALTHAGVRELTAVWGRSLGAGITLTEPVPGRPNLLVGVPGSALHYGQR